MIRLPAISLWQPWASLCFTPRHADFRMVKVHETRHWPAPPRVIGQRVLIHAAQKRCRFEADEISELCERAFPMGADYPTELPYGAYVGSALLAGSNLMPVAQPAHDDDEIAGNWEPGRFAWLLDEPRALKEPIPAKGRQGWWTAEVDEALL